MNENFGKTSCAPRPDLAPDAFTKVQNAWPNSETPALVSETVFCPIEREGGDILRVGSVAHEASCSVGIEPDHKEKREVMRVPERLEALCTDLVMSGGVHEDHDKQHEVACDAASLLVVDVESVLRTNL